MKSTPVTAATCKPKRKPKPKPKPKHRWPRRLSTAAALSAVRGLAGAAGATVVELARWWITTR